MNEKAVVQSVAALSLFGAISALLVNLFFTHGWAGVQKDATIADHAKVASIVMGCVFLVGALSSTAITAAKDSVSAIKDTAEGTMGGQYEFNDSAHKKYTDTVREFLRAHRRE